MWAPLPAPRAQEGRCCAFVDGVRRIDARLFAEEGDVTRAGARRIVGGRLRVVLAAAVDRGRHDRARARRRRWAAADPARRRGRALTSRHRRSPEPTRSIRSAACRTRCARRRPCSPARRSRQQRAELVVADGPLDYAMPGRIVGMVKRQSRALPRRRPRAGDPAAQSRRAHADLQARRAAARALLVVPAARRRPPRSTARWPASCDSRSTPRSGLEAAQRARRARRRVLPTVRAASPGTTRARRRTCIPSGRSRRVLRHRLGDAAADPPRDRSGPARGGPRV